MSDSTADPLAKGWYYRKQGKAQGPVDRQRLQAMIQSRELLADAEVWHPSLSSWQAAAHHFRIARPRAPVLPPKPVVQRANFDLGHDPDRPEVNPVAGEQPVARNDGLEHYPEQGSPFSRPLIVLALVALALLVYGFWPASDGGTDTSTAGSAARDLSTLSMVADSESRVLRVSGPMQPGFANAVMTQLRLRPELNTVVLASDGGELDEAYQLGQYLATQRGATLRVSGRCTGACVVVLLSAPIRHIEWDAQVRFLPPAQLIAAGGGSADPRAVERYRTLMLDAGLPAEFVHRAVTRAERGGFVPEITELLAARVVFAVVSDDQVLDRNQWQGWLLDKRLAEDPQRAPLRELLQQLAQHDPTLHARAVEALSPAPEGRSPLTEPEVLTLIAGATSLRSSDTLVVAWLDARLDQLRYLRDQRLFADCRSYLAGERLSQALDPALYRAELQALAAMIADARGRTAQTIDRQLAGADAEELEQAAASFHQARFGDRVDTTPAEDDQIHCRVRTEHLDRWIRLPTTRAANLARNRYAG